jgi:hypothetical protein
MTAQETIDGFLRGVGHSLNVDLALDANGARGFACRDGLECLISVSESAEVVSFEAAIKVVYDPQFSASLFRRALEYNLDPSLTAGMALGYDGIGKTMILRQAWLVHGLDECAFGNALGRFILSESAVADPVIPAAQPLPGDLDTMGIRV